LAKHGEAQFGCHCGVDQAFLCLTSLSEPTRNQLQAAHLPGISAFFCCLLLLLAGLLPALAPDFLPHSFPLLVLAACSSFLVGSESDVKQRQPQAEGLVRPSVAWCFSMAKPMFWRLEGCNLELASCRFRKRR